MISVLLAVAFAQAAAPAAPSSQPPAQATFSIRLQAAPDRAFPMFDPVNETRWAPDWHPALLGDGRVAAGLVFTTDDNGSHATWLLDRYEPVAHTIRYVIVRTTTLTTLDIAVEATGPATSRATVSYTRTALDARANDSLAAFAQHVTAEAPHWEAAINAALR